jgi:hypothetical protein
MMEVLALAAIAVPAIVWAMFTLREHRHREWLLWRVSHR